MLAKRQILIILIALGCYLAALAPRLYQLESRIVQADEMHWSSRAAEFTKRIDREIYDQATTHFSQPGLPPGVIMSYGQRIAKYINQKNGSSYGDDNYVDRLYASRFMNACFSALIAPIVFVAVYLLLGLSPALFASLLLAVDPHSISYSRIAHVDTGLTVFTAITVFVYLAAEIKQNVALKILGGAIWGFCLATKPTSAAIVVAFVIFRVLQRFGILGESRRKLPVLTWSDFYAVIVGHITFSLIYTRFWHTNSPYVWRLNIHNKFADWLYATGTTLGSTPKYITIALLAIIASYLLWTFIESKKNLNTSRISINFFATITFVLLTWSVYPAVYENILRYWLWAAGLSNETHSSYGLTWEPPALGYFGMYFRHLPSIVFIFIVVSLVYLVFSLKKPDTREKNSNLVLLYLIILAFIWSALLNVSSKQSIRYALPVVPALYVFASVGIWKIFDKYLSSSLVKQLLVVLIVVFNAASVLQWQPHYSLFHNRISGGLERAVAVKEVLPPIGEGEAVDFLVKKSIEEDKVFLVSVIGDASTVKKTLEFKYPKFKERLKFISSEHKHSADYVIFFPAFWRWQDEFWSDWKEQGYQEVFVHRAHEADLVKVYSVGYFSLDEPMQIDIKHTPKRTGRHIQFGEKKDWVVVGEPGRDAKGYIMHGQRLRVKKGTYRVTFAVGMPKNDLDLDSKRFAARLELSKNCSRIVRREELLEDMLENVSFDCKFDADTSAQLRVYWWGRVPFVATGPIVKRVE